MKEEQVAQLKEHALFDIEMSPQFSGVVESQKTEILQMFERDWQDMVSNMDPGTVAPPKA